MTNVATATTAYVVVPDAAEGDNFLKALPTVEDARDFLTGLGLVATDATGTRFTQLIVDGEPTDLDEALDEGSAEAAALLTALFGDDDTCGDTEGIPALELRVRPAAG